MKKIILSLYGKSPACLLSSRAVTNVEETLDFIPGTALRGALAKEWLNRNGNRPDEIFRKLFIDGVACYGNLYKEGGAPIPLSAFSCKYYPGFKRDTMLGAGTQTHGVIDMVLPTLKAPGGALPVTYQVCKDATCPAPMKKINGYCRNRSGNWEKVPVARRLIYRTGISPETETAKEKALYSLDVVEEGQNFIGELIVLDDALAKDLVTFMGSLDRLNIGSDKSRGQGFFEVGSVQDDAFDVNETGIHDRINRFNEELGLHDGHIYFTLTLKSDAIMTDRYLRHIAYIDLGDAGGRPILGFNDTRIVSGWNALLKLPKEDDLAISKGSVFIYKIERLSDNILAILQNIETNGIGKRRSEGFGRVSVCDPFHWSGGEVK